MEKASREAVEAPTQAEILGCTAGVIAGVLALGFLVLAAVTSFAVKFGENIMNYGS